MRISRTRTAGHGRPLKFSPAKKPAGAAIGLGIQGLPGILPPLEAEEALEASMVRSLAGDLGEGRLSRRRTFRDPHHSATLQALIGGGARARPGEVSLAHHGVLFLDELPEFNRTTLEALRQPLESGRVTVARANAHVTYPARFQLVAAMNPCRCGHAFEPGFACKRGRIDRCTSDYQSRISGPLMDRIDQLAPGPVERLPELHMPTLILWGERDRLIPMQWGREFEKAIPGSRLVVFPGLGHVPHEEDPAATLAALRAWLPQVAR